MAGIAVNVKFDMHEMFRKLGSTRFMRAAQRWGAKTAVRMEHEAKIRCPVDTGRLKGSITNRLVETASNVSAVTGTNVHYAAYQEFGTGLYGPRKRVIRPMNARVLSWQPRGGARIFARFVRGVRPRAYFQGALKAAYPIACQSLDEEMKREMETA